MFILGFNGTGWTSPPYVPGEILVAFKTGTPESLVNRLHSKVGALEKYRQRLTGIRRLRIPEHLTVKQAILQYVQDPNVLYAEPNYIRRPFVTLPNDPDFSDQWYLDTIEAPQAWDIETGSPDFVIALIDSGVDYKHLDLDDNIWTNSDEELGDANGDGFPGLAGVDDDGDGLVDEDSQGFQPGDPGYTNDLADDDDENGFVDDTMGWNFVGDQVCTKGSEDECICPQDDPDIPDDPGNNNPMDDYGHGTHVAGIAAAEGNNGIGVSGVLWQAQIMPLKIIDQVGCGSVIDEVQAIEYAIAQKAHVINASFGGEGNSQAERDAIAAAGSAGILFVAAAGNQGRNNDSNPIFPAGYDLPNIISVSASNARDRLTVFSNFGQNSVDIAAPGECLLSTTPIGNFTLKGEAVCGQTLLNNQGFLSGTSQAAPQVSGTAGLLFSQDPTLTMSEIRSMILLTSDAKDSLSGKVASSGRLNARRVLTREAGSGLSGGGGGCGGFGITKNEGASPETALLFLFFLFWPALIPLIRRWKISRAQSDYKGNRERYVSSLMVLMAMLFSAELVRAEESRPFTGFYRPHSIALKLGYHLYPSSDYFDTNAAFVGPEDVSSLSGELEYDYRYDRDGSVSFALGYYGGSTDADGLCCTELKFQNLYLLVSPKFYVWSRKKWEGYVGGGVGYYRFKLEQTGLIPDSLSEFVGGFHGLAGLRWSMRPHLSGLIEFRYARAVVKSANALDDALDIGGINLSVGVVYHFPERL